jgi:hypothetical protein
VKVVPRYQIFLKNFFIQNCLISKNIPRNKLIIITEYCIFFSVYKNYTFNFLSLKKKEIYVSPVDHRISEGSKSGDCIYFFFEITLDECLDRILLKLATWNLEVVPNLSVVSFLYRIISIWISLGEVVSDLTPKTFPQPLFQASSVLLGWLLISSFHC